MTSHHNGDSPDAPPHSDALVLFGATGDLAHKKIFPALYAMAKRHALSVPVIGVASSQCSLEQLRARVRDSVAEHADGVVDEDALAHLLGRSTAWRARCSPRMRSSASIISSARRRS
jgi:glucose-6-phosphate 1-dehydrogenase